MTRGGFKTLMVGCWVLACSKDVDGGAGFASGGGPPGSASTSGSSVDSDGPGASDSTGEGNDSGNGQGSGETTSTSSGLGNDPATTSAGETTSGGGDANPSASSTATTEESSTSADSMGGSDLDPDLDVPSEGEPCDTPGFKSECPGFTWCRFYDSDEGRCESCEACGNLGAFCDTGEDCDVLFSCFRGVCTNFCTLGQSECGPVEDCLDIGHPTRGVCDPAGI